MKYCLDSNHTEASNTFFWLLMVSVHSKFDMLNVYTHLEIYYVHIELLKFFQKSSRIRDVIIHGIKF